MIVINPPLAIYKHLAALSFMLAGVFADLLVVRLCLTSAYVFLIVNGLLGSPLWPHLYRKGHLTVDMLIWGFICFYVHMSSVIRLLLDEQHVTLTQHEEALWRMFYRVGGLSRKLFKHHIAEHMKVVKYEKGQVIPVEEYFHITYEGTVEIKIHDENTGKLIQTAIDGSGCMFDFKRLGLMQTLTSPMSRHKLIVTAKSDCTFFEFSNQDIRSIANAKVTKSVWQTVFIGTLARIAVQRLGEEHMDPKRSDPTHLDPLFTPLSASETPDPLLAGSGAALERPLAHIAYCMRRFFTPPWPFGKHLIGIRHNMLQAPVPTEGATDTIERRIDGKDHEGQSLLPSSSDGNGASKYRSIV